MGKDIKRMDIKEFRAKGFLQEANRLFFHPLGLALEVVTDDKTGQEELGGIWDYREDPEGILFSKELISNSDSIIKAKFISELKASKLKARQKIDDVDSNGIQIIGSDSV